MLRNKLFKYFFKLKNSDNLAKQQRYKCKLNLYKQLAGAASVCICDMEPGSTECPHCYQPGVPSSSPEPPASASAVLRPPECDKCGKEIREPKSNEDQVCNCEVQYSSQPIKKPSKLRFDRLQELHGIFNEQGILGNLDAFHHGLVDPVFSCRLHPENCIYYKEFEAYRDAHAKKMMQLKHNVRDPIKWEDYYDNGPDVTSKNRVSHRSDKFDMISYFDHFDDPTGPRYKSFRHRDHTECFKNTFLQHRQYVYKIEELRIQSYVNLKEICDYYLAQDLNVFSELDELHIGLQSHITSIPDEFPFVFPKLGKLVIEIGIKTLPESFSSCKMLRSLRISFPMDIATLPVMETVQFVEFIKRRYINYHGHKEVKVPINTSPDILKSKFPLLDTFTDTEAMCVGCKPTKKE